MKAAIYARYSSESQSEKSIDDQIRVCQKYARENGMTIEDGCLYSDEAVSGSIVDRPGLHALERAAGNKEFDAVIVDDLSRLSRSNYQMMTMVLKFNYYCTKIISVSDGINTDDENSKLGIQLRGLVNELYLDDLRKKTMRGLEGQKLRGFSTGERVYGYDSKPFGKSRPNGRNGLRYEGMVHEIHPQEAEVVKSIFRYYLAGNSIHKIASILNQDKVPTKKDSLGKWCGSTVSRLLRNSKYIGTWDWRKTRRVSDPTTGKKRSCPRPEKERVSLFREDLVVIDQETWEKAQKKRRELDTTRPMRRSERGTLQQTSYVHAYPKHLLSGLMRCGLCGGSIVIASGKRGGYYGCLSHRRRTCQNSFMIKRERIEHALLERLTGEILTTERLEEGYKALEEAEASRTVLIPSLLKDKESELADLQRMTGNCIDHIKAGNSSKSVAEEIKKLEEKMESLHSEIEALKTAENTRFKAPSRTWIKSRLDRLKQDLESPNASLTIKELMAPILLEPTPNGCHGGHSFLVRAAIKLATVSDSSVPRFFQDLSTGSTAGNIPLSFVI